MQSNINKSFVWLWMAALLSASIGISVQQVYCYCVGKTTVSLYLAEDACQTPAVSDQANCCSPKPIAKKPDCCKKNSQEKKGCTKKSTKVYQLKTDSELASSAFKKLDIPKISLSINAVFADNQPFTVFENAVFFGFVHPPPAISGRMKCLRYGVFRC